jgi:hypothetical protein
MANFCFQLVTDQTRIPGLMFLYVIVSTQRTEANISESGLEVESQCTKCLAEEKGLYTR